MLDGETDGATQTEISGGEVKLKKRNEKNLNVNFNRSPASLAATRESAAPQVCEEQTDGALQQMVRETV